MDTLAQITDPDLLTVTIGTAGSVKYTYGAAATSAEGATLHALLLLQVDTDPSKNKGVFFSECGPFIIGRGARKRAG